MKTRRRTIQFANLPRDYAGLLKFQMLRPIHDEIDLANATEIIDAMAGHDLTPDQDDYLEAWATLVTAYEDQHHPVKIPRVDPAHTLNYLVEQSGMTASALGELLGNRSLGSKLLRGDRQLSKTHICKLASHFKVSTDLFLM